MELGSHVFCKGHYYRIKLKTKWNTLIPEKHIVKQVQKIKKSFRKFLLQLRSKEIWKWFLLSEDVQHSRTLLTNVSVFCNILSIHTWIENLKWCILRVAIEH